jgi:DNA-3-methyladenine glycosylase
MRRAEIPEDATELARFLIGRTLVRERGRARIVGRIVETEAYLPHDAAAHSFIGMTPRNRSLFLEHGHAYVYFCYGAHFMLNVSAGPEGVGCGVLLRAIEPMNGNVRPAFDFARGPGRLAKAFHVDRRFDGIDLCATGPLWLGGALAPIGEIGTSVRIGISKDAHRPLRFFERGNPHVSGPRRLNGDGAKT